MKEDRLNIGDLVEVLDPGLAQLRKLCPQFGPNHHGVVSEIWDDGSILVLFPDGQAAPYPPQEVRLRAAGGEG